MEPRQCSLHVNDIDLVWFEWAGANGNDDAPLVFAHATGFHARVWDAVIEHFAGRRVISIDLRGHGRSGGGPITHWQSVSDDVNALIDHLGLENAMGIGHSMGAHVLLQCAADRTGAFANLVLFDPVILAPEFYAPASPLFTADNPHPASRRKADFSSPEAMMERFRTRDPFNLFAPRVLEDYCRYGLLPSATGEGFELACAPQMEASVYASSRSNSGILETAKAVDTPTLIIRAQQSDVQDFKGSPTWPPLAETMPAGTDLDRSDHTHFHPFEDPADAAAIIERAISG
ncbi:alpha/beta fold hydrolase [Erythrobacter sp. MTPC3]|uniref:alpha/beta fold hydrolase n=1 Tax=Erythrobacter sp. MTPC3 TaxID=3056564 RepID=UPI0036F21756